MVRLLNVLIVNLQFILLASTTIPPLAFANESDLTIKCSDIHDETEEKEREKKKNKFIEQNGKYLVVVDLYLVDGSDFTLKSRSTGVLASDDGAIIVDYTSVVEPVKDFVNKKEKYKIYVYKNNHILEKPISPLDDKIDKEEINNYLGKDNPNPKRDSQGNIIKIFKANIWKYEETRRLSLLSIHPSHIKDLDISSINTKNLYLGRETGSNEHKNLCTLGYDDIDNKINIYLKYAESLGSGVLLRKLENIKTSNHNKTQSGGLVFLRDKIFGIINYETDHVIPITYYDSLFPKIFLSNFKNEVGTKFSTYDTNNKNFISFREDWYKFNNIKWRLNFYTSDQNNCELSFTGKKSIVAPPYVQGIRVLVFLNTKKPGADDHLKYMLIKEELTNIGDLKAGEFCIGSERINKFLEDNKQSNFNSLTFKISPYINLNADKAKDVKILENSLPIDDSGQHTKNDKKIIEIIDKYEKDGWRSFRSLTFPAIPIKDNKLPEKKKYQASTYSPVDIAPE